MFRRFQSWVREWLLGGLATETVKNQARLELQIAELRGCLLDELSDLGNRLADSERQTAARIAGVSEGLRDGLREELDLAPIERDCVALAVNKQLADPQFCGRADEDVRVREAVLWTEHYMRERGGHPPGRDRVEPLIRRRLYGARN